MQNAARDRLRAVFSMFVANAFRACSEGRRIGGAVMRKRLLSARNGASLCLAIWSIRASGAPENAPRLSFSPVGFL